MFRRFGFGGRVTGMLALLAATLALSGCGGGGGSDDSVPPSKPTLVMQVTGSGTVESAPAGLSCSAICNAEFPLDTAVTLTATPSSGQSFSGWGGACAGSGPTCVVSMKTEQSVSALFVPVAGSGPFLLSAMVLGNGAISSQPAGLSCSGASCSGTFAANTPVVLTATPGENQSFAGWSGACAGSSECNVSMTQARSVTATFVPASGTTITLTTSVSGDGKITSVPLGIDCGSTCSAPFASSTNVTLTATANAGQVFSGWGGACSGAQASCTLQMTQARAAQAVFVAAPPSSPGWQAAQLLESSNDFNVDVAGSNLLVATGPNGNAMVLWEQSDGKPNGSTRKVFSRRFISGGGWEAPVVISGLTANNVSQKMVTGQLLMDAAGVVTWIRKENRMETRRYVPGTGWGAAFEAPGTTTFHNNHEITSAVMDDSGNISVLASGGNVWNSALLAGASSWIDWIRVDNGGALQGTDAKLSLSSNGTALAIWKERNPGDTNNSMKANDHRAGRGWGTAVSIEEDVTRVADAAPALTMDSNGNGIAMWRHDRAFYYNLYKSGIGWGGAVPIVGESFLLSSTGSIQVAMAPDGRAVATWTGSQFALRSMQYTPSTGWSAPVSVEALNTDRRTLFVLNNGQAVMTYRTPLPGTADFRAFSRSLTLGGQWSDRTRIDRGVGQVNSLYFSANKAGKGVAIWDQDDVANSDVRNSLWGAVLP